MDWNHIDLNGLLHLGGLVAGGYVAAATLHWMVTDFIVPLIEILAAVTIVSRVLRSMRAYFEWKKAEALAARPAPPAIGSTKYVSPLHARLRRD